MDCHQHVLHKYPVLLYAQCTMDTVHHELILLFWSVCNEKGARGIFGEYALQSGIAAALAAPESLWHSSSAREMQAVTLQSGIAAALAAQEACGTAAVQERCKQ